MKVEKRSKTPEGGTPTEEAQQLFVTPAAVRAIHRLLEDEGLSRQTHGLRVRVKGGGCSGYTYEMDWDKPGPDDRIFEKDGARAIVDPGSLQYVAGSRLTYLNQLQQAGFTLLNPNVTGSCGCGVSFSV